MKSSNEQDQAESIKNARLRIVRQCRGIDEHSSEPISLPEPAWTYTSESLPHNVGAVWTSARNQGTFILGAAASSEGSTNEGRGLSHSASRQGPDQEHEVGSDAKLPAAQLTMSGGANNDVPVASTSTAKPAPTAEATANQGATTSSVKKAFKASKGTAGRPRGRPRTRHPDLGRASKKPKVPTAAAAASDASASSTGARATASQGQHPVQHIPEQRANASASPEQQRRPPPGPPPPPLPPRNARRDNATADLVPDDIPVDDNQGREVRAVPGSTASRITLRSFEVTLLASIIKHREKQNKPVTRSEIIDMIMYMRFCPDKRKAYACLEDLQERDRGGFGAFKFPIVAKARSEDEDATSTASETVKLMKQEFVWQATMYHRWKEQALLNKPQEDFQQLKDHFTLRLEIACALLDDGNLITLDYDRYLNYSYIPGTERFLAFYVVSASGNSGPLLFLTSSDASSDDSQFSMLRESLRESLKNSRRVPSSSDIFLTPDGLPSNETLPALVRLLAEGIRSMPTISEHPDWWAVLSTKGFPTREMNMLELHSLFWDKKILVAEDVLQHSTPGDTRDQTHELSKGSCSLRYLISNPRTPCRIHNKWKAMDLCLSAIENATVHGWVSSFARTNLHPGQCIPFKEWMELFHERITSSKRPFDLYDAAPACWKSLSVTDRIGIVCLIGTWYSEDDNTKPGSSSEDIEKGQQTYPVWTPGRSVELAKYVPLDKVPLLLASYFASRHDFKIMGATKK